MQTTEPVTEQFGHLTVITWTDAERISINTFTAGTRNSGLSACYPHTEREAAKAWYRTIRDSALAGTPVWLIEAEVAALIDASPAVAAAEQDMVTGINTTMDATQPTPVDVSDILADMPVGGSLAAYRRNVRNDYSRTRIAAKPPTEAELDRIRAAHRNADGTLTVTRAPGQPWTVLKALHNRLGGKPTYKPGTARVIDALTYQPEQLAGYLTEERAA